MREVPAPEGLVYKQDLTLSATRLSTCGLHGKSTLAPHGTSPELVDVRTHTPLRRSDGVESGAIRTLHVSTISDCRIVVSIASNCSVKGTSPSMAARDSRVTSPSPGW